MYHRQGDPAKGLQQPLRRGMPRLPLGVASIQPLQLLPSTLQPLPHYMLHQSQHPQRQRQQPHQPFGMVFPLHVQGPDAQGPLEAVEVPLNPRCPPVGPHPLSQWQLLNRCIADIQAPAQKTAYPGDGWLVPLHPQDVAHPHFPAPQALPILANGLLGHFLMVAHRQQAHHSIALQDVLHRLLQGCQVSPLPLAATPWWRQRQEGLLRSRQPLGQTPAGLPGQRGGVHHQDSLFPGDSFPFDHSLLPAGRFIAQGQQLWGFTPWDCRLLLGLNLPLIGLWVRLLEVPYRYLAVLVVVICIVGAYSVNNSVFDVGTMVAFGVVGFLMGKGGFPPAPMVLAMILGPQLERTLQQSLIAARGDLGIFFQRPISATLMALAVVMLLSPLLRQVLSRKFAPAAGPSC